MIDERPARYWMPRVTVFSASADALHVTGMKDMRQHPSRGARLKGLVILKVSSVLCPDQNLLLDRDLETAERRTGAV